jgi:hypothetical protein
MKYTPQLLICSVSFASAFHNWPKGATRVRRRLRQVQRLRSPPLGAQVQLDNPWTTCDTALGELFEACQEATIPAPLDSNEGSHDSSRWEWGTWVNLESLENLMVKFKRRIHMLHCKCVKYTMSSQARLLYRVVTIDTSLLSCFDVRCVHRLQQTRWRQPRGRGLRFLQQWSQHLQKLRKRLPPILKAQTTMVPD